MARSLLKHVPRCILRSNERFDDLLKTFPKSSPPFRHEKCGAIMVSRSDEEDKNLEIVKEKAEKNGVHVSFLSLQQVRGASFSI